MNIKKFWTDLMIGFAGPGVWNKLVDQEMRDKETKYKLGCIKAFVEATKISAHNEISKMWAEDTLTYINKLMEMYSGGDKNNG